MAQNELKLNDVGTNIIITICDQSDIPVDVSGASSILYYFRTSRGTSIIKSGSLNTDGKNCTT